MKGFDKLYDGAQLMREFASEIEKGRALWEVNLISLKEIKKEAVIYILPLKLEVTITNKDNMPFTEFTDENPPLKIGRGAQFETDEKNTIAGMTLVGLSLIVNYTALMGDMKENLDEIEKCYLETLSMFDIDGDNRRELRIMLTLLKKGFKGNTANIKIMASTFNDITSYITMARENIGLFEN